MSGKSIKIMHVIDSLGVGGMERVVIDVVNGLDPAIFAQTVCCISRRGEASRFLRAGVDCLDLGKGADADYLMPLRIARAIRQKGPEIIHTQSWSGVDAGIATLMMRDIRLVHSEHGRNLPYIHSEPVKRKIARRCLYHLADAVFAVSHEVRDYYCRETGFPVDRMRVIPNGIDLRRIEEVDRRGVRQELGIADDDFVIGTIARLDETKDTLTLARAFAGLQQSRPDARLKLLVVGNGDKKVEIEQYFIERGLSHAVILTGVRHDVPRLLGAMNLFALSSLSEGMPITALEAMGASLPIVATNVGALPELVDEGVTGFLVEPKDDAALAGRMEQLYDNRAMAREFGMAGRRKAEREYGIDQMLQRYADLYLSVAGKNFGRLPIKTVD
jgi:sugar transferase (PEP-CTERM/EpsH1 system associated)